jgi:hypothetical protein
MMTNVIIDARLPTTGCLSWIRTYHTGAFADDAPADLVDQAQRTGLQLTSIDVDRLSFFDIQVLRHGHVARLKLPPVTVTGAVTIADAANPPSSRSLRAPVITHVLLHQSGFAVVRPIIRFDKLEIEGGLHPSALHQLERGVWSMSSRLEWHLPGLDRPMPGYVRNYMNYIFLDLLNRWSGDRTRPVQLAEWATEGMHGCDRLHELTAAGVLEHPYPVSFGTEIQVALPRATEEPWGTWNERAAALAWVVMRPPGTTVDTPPTDFESDAQSVAWFMDENVSLLVRAADSGLDPELDLVDTDRGQITEFLALRRGALSNVQRATQRVLTERIAVSRQQVAHWQNQVATLTDDYVLHSRSAVLLEPLKQNFANERRLRDLKDLAEQVKANLEWFQARIEANAEWTGGLVGAAVGAAALAISLTEPVRILVARFAGTSVDEVADQYGVVLASAILAVVLLSFAVSFSLVRSLSNRLRPSAGTKRPRLSGRRRSRRVPRQRAATDNGAAIPSSAGD